MNEVIRLQAPQNLAGAAGFLPFDSAIAQKSNHDEDEEAGSSLRMIDEFWANWHERLGLLDVEKNRVIRMNRTAAEN